LWALLNTTTKATFHCPHTSFATFVPNCIPLLTKLSPKIAVHGPKTRSGSITKLQIVTYKYLRSWLVLILYDVPVTFSNSGHRNPFKQETVRLVLHNCGGEENILHDIVRFMRSLKATTSGVCVCGDRSGDDATPTTLKLATISIIPSSVSLSPNSGCNERQPSFTAMRNG